MDVQSQDPGAPAGVSSLPAGGAMYHSPAGLAMGLGLAMVNHLDRHPLGQCFPGSPAPLCYWAGWH